jgi:hypothetical protein
LGIIAYSYIIPIAFQCVFLFSYFLPLFNNNTQQIDHESDTMMKDKKIIGNEEEGLQQEVMYLYYRYSIYS